MNPRTCAFADAKQRNPHQSHGSFPRRTRYKDAGVGGACVRKLETSQVETFDTMHFREEPSSDARGAGLTGRLTVSMLSAGNTTDSTVQYQKCPLKQLPAEIE